MHTVKNIGLVGAKAISTALKGNTTVTKVDLSGNRQLSSLSSFSLGNRPTIGNQIGPGVAKAIAKAIKTNSGVTILDISGTELELDMRAGLPDTHTKAIPSGMPERGPFQVCSKSILR